ncbi:MAG: hypothetical protein U0L76_00990 [Ruminococcus sp.]|nr:hypothetical protein [Ruminococcus sp.]
MSNDLQRSDKGFLGALKSLTMSNTDRANRNNRSVAEYKPNAIETFFDTANGVYNAVISGGDPYFRNKALLAQAVCAKQNNFPVIVLHEGNYQLEQQLRRNFSVTNQYCEISTRSPCFEPLYGLNELEIANQILETAPKDYDIKYNARYYIDGISSFLKASGKHLSFKLFSTCPHGSIFDKVDDLELQGTISSYQSQEIKSKLMTGQSENYKIDTFLSSFKMEIEPFMYKPKQGNKPENILSTLKKGKVLSFDISSVTNRILINTIIYQLKLALSKGFQYTVLIDSISVNSNESYANYLKTPSDKICKTIASEDFYSMVGSDEKLFSAALGEAQTVIVMNHSSGHTANKWAEFFGQYDKYEQSYSNTRGRSRRTPFSLFSSPNTSRTVNISKNREYIVKPEMITRMGSSEAYVMAASIGQLAHISFNG